MYRSIVSCLPLSLSAKDLLWVVDLCVVVGEGSIVSCLPVCRCRRRIYRELSYVRFRRWIYRVPRGHVTNGVPACALDCIRQTFAPEESCAFVYPRWVLTLCVTQRLDVFSIASLKISGLLSIVKTEISCWLGWMFCYRVYWVTVTWYRVDQWLAVGCCCWLWWVCVVRRSCLWNERSVGCCCSCEWW